jgi:HEAT repeat protein/TolA-binding protein
MNRITLASMFVVAVAAAPVMAQDPTPPARPVRPAEPVRPAPTPRPAIAPRPPFMSDYDIDRLRDQAREMERMSRDFDHLIPPMAMDVQRMTAEATREVMANQREIAAAAREASRAVMDNQREYADMAREASRAAMEVDRQFRDFQTPMPYLAPMPALAPMAPMAPLGPTGVYRYSDDFVIHAPPAPWAQGDPADSLYRLARGALSQGEYGRAARAFQEISQKYPTSAYKADVPYYEATARYRIGTTDELRGAVKLLEPLVAKITASGTTTTTVSNYPPAQRSYFGNQRASDSEVMALYLRINGALAQRGDREAADRVAKSAKSGSACDNEDVQVKVEALNALSQNDAAQAAPMLRKVLDRKDECSIELRRRAVFMLGRRGDTESATLLVATAKSDPSASVRNEAITWLPRLPGDVGVNSLEDILRNEQDENIQRAVVHALMQSDNQKARSSMRGLIDRKDASANLRIEAINSFNAEHATADDAAYLRGLYGKTDNDRVKDAIIRAISRIGGTENDTWVLNLAKNTNEPGQFRATAISRLMQSNSVSIADLGKLYDAADSYTMRSQLINVLRGRKEPEASDRLVEIVKTGTDYKLKMQALNAISSRNDPRAQQLLTEILDGKKP